MQTILTLLGQPSSGVELEVSIRFGTVMQRQLVLQHVQEEAKLKEVNYCTADVLT